MTHYSDHLDEQIREILQDIPEQLVAAKTGINPTIRQEYLARSEQIDLAQNTEKDIVYRVHRLFSSDTPITERQDTLIILAHLGGVKSYRTIEGFAKVAEAELQDWGLLALEECRLLLEHSLLEREQTLVITGLGSEDNRLRYFALLRAIGGKDFTDAQKSTISTTLWHVCRQYNSVLEEINVRSNYATITLLIPLDVAVGEVIEAGIGECNTYIRFVNEHYYVTNVKIPSDQEALAYLND